ncbi:site-specific DNA-methyltransferase, partial [Streptococcus pyogenes]
MYARDVKEFSSYRNLLPATEELLSRYKNPDNDPRGPWQSVSLNVQAGHAVSSQFYNVVAPS